MRHYVRHSLEVGNVENAITVAEYSPAFIPPIFATGHPARFSCPEARFSEVYEMGRMTAEGTSHGRGRVDQPRATGEGTTLPQSKVWYVSQMPVGKAIIL